MKMVRKQVYITPEQDKKLKQSSRRLGVTEAELIRRGIDLIDDEAVAREAERRAAWQNVLDSMLKRVEMFPGSTDKFDREEVYAERLDRLG